MLMSEAILGFNQWRNIRVKDATVRGYDHYLRQFCIFLRNPEIEAVTLQQVVDWFSLMEDLDYAQNAFMPKAMALRKFFEFYTKLSYKVIDPWLIPIPRKEFNMPRVANEENYRKLLSVIPRDTNVSKKIRDLAIITLLWDTGARNGEIMSLNIEDIDLHERKALIKTEKSRGRRPFRELFWSYETNEHMMRWVQRRRKLQDQLEKCDKEALFISMGTITSGGRLKNKGLSDMLRKYSNDAGLKQIMNPHSFRHHKGHEIIKKNGSSSDVMNILGHSTLASSSVYTMMADSELEERAKKFLAKDEN